MRACQGDALVIRWAKACQGFFNFLRDIFWAYFPWLVRPQILLSFVLSLYGYMLCIEMPANSNDLGLFHQFPTFLRNTLGDGEH